MQGLLAPLHSTVGDSPGVWSGFRFGIWGFGFGVWGSGSGKRGLRFGVWFLEFGGWDVGFRVPALGFWVQGFGVRGSGFSGVGLQGFESRISNSGLHTVSRWGGFTGLDFRFWVLGEMVWGLGRSKLCGGPRSALVSLTSLKAF